MNMPSQLADWKGRLAAQLGQTPDLVFRMAGGSLVVYMSGLVKMDRLEREIVSPLMGGEEPTTPNIQWVRELPPVVVALLAGSAAVVRTGREEVLLAEVSSMPSRNIDAPETEAVIRGPREGFTELMETNVSLLRRILRTDKLRMKVWRIGELTQTEVRLVYLEGVTPPKLVEEMEKRLSAVRMDAVLESNFIEEAIQDHPWSIFPTIQFTQRPDVTVSSLLDGKIAILTSNTPFALIAPFQFWSAFTSNEDYYLSYSSGTFLRLIRSLATIISLLLPSLYVAIVSFHPGMIPTKLLLSIASTREPSPFPVIIEAVIMELTFEALREAALRLPRAMGQTVSIVGALVIGQAVVQAGIISVPMVVIVSLTGVTSLMFPRYNITFSIRMLRFFILVLAGSMGLFGVVMALFIIGIYMTGIRSAGMPYLSPLAPLSPSRLKDSVVRLPLWLMRKRVSREEAEANVSFESHGQGKLVQPFVKQAGFFRSRKNGGNKP